MLAPWTCEILLLGLRQNWLIVRGRDPTKQFHNNNNLSSFISSFNLLNLKYQDEKKIILLQDGIKLKPNIHAWLHTFIIANAIYLEDATICSKRKKVQLSDSPSNLNLGIIISLTFIFDTKILFPKFLLRWATYKWKAHDNSIMFQEDAASQISFCPILFNSHFTCSSKRESHYYILEILCWFW